MSNDKDADKAHLPQISIDLKLPLWGLVTFAGAVVWGCVSMYFTLNDVSNKVSELQGSVKSANANAITLTSEQALIKFRLEKLEAEYAKGVK